MSTASLHSDDPTPTSPLREVPGDPGLPLLGNTLQWMRDPVALLGHRYRKYGPVSWTHIFGTRMVQMLGPDANQFVFQNRGDLFSSSGGWDYFIGRFFTRGIMLLDFEEHRQHRQIMQSAFKKPVMVKYLEQMNPIIARAMDQWPVGSSFDFLVFDRIKQLTLDIATEVFMGYKLGPEADRLNQAFIDTVRAGTSVLRYPVPGSRWWKGLRGRKVLEDFFRAQIPEKRRNPGNDMFSVLCCTEDDNGHRFSDDDIINHMIFLMMAAHDTSTITLCSIFHQLARAPDWQERVRAEAQAFNKPGLAHDDLEQATIMTKVMKEALRLCAPVPSLPRRTTRDVEFNGYRIPAGTMINVVPYFTHYMGEYWSRPFEFDPDRFSERRQEHKSHPYAWVPFGGGAHMCIGLHFAELQVKAILHQAAQRFRWSVPAGYEMPVDTSSLPVPADHLPVRLEPV